MKVFVLIHEEARRRAVEAVREAEPGMVVVIKPKTRTLEQNSRMWALLHDISTQVEWYGKKLTAEDWKIVFTAALKKMTVVPSLDGAGFVALGQSTSRMTKAELSDLMTLIESFGVEKGVVFAEPPVDR